MKLGVFAKTFAGTDPYSVLAAVRAANFEAAQYNMACSGLGPLPVSIPDEIANHIKSASDAARIEIAAVSATYNMTDPDKARRAAGRRAFTAIAGAARRMGTGLVTVCSGSKDPQDQWRRHPANDDPASWIEMCREIEFMLGLAEQHDLTIGVEPEPANVVSSPSNAARLLSDFSGSRLRIILDPANILEGVPPGRQHSTIDLAFDLLGPAIVLAHAKDRHSDGRVAPAGEGTVDWNYFLTGLSSLGFDGHLIAHGMSANEAPSVAYYLRQELTRI
jgi:sugar phosphate isomerase/epimerase